MPAVTLCCHHAGGRDGEHQLGVEDRGGAASYTRRHQRLPSHQTDAQRKVSAQVCKLIFIRIYSTWFIKHWSRDFIVERYKIVCCELLYQLIYLQVMYFSHATWCIAIGNRPQLANYTDCLPERSEQ